MKLIHFLQAETYKILSTRIKYLKGFQHVSVINLHSTSQAYLKSNLEKQAQG
jgi:hypothetical protein